MCGGGDRLRGMPSRAPQACNGRCNGAAVEGCLRLLCVGRPVHRWPRSALPPPRAELLCGRWLGLEGQPLPPSLPPVLCLAALCCRGGRGDSVRNDLHLPSVLHSRPHGQGKVQVLNVLIPGRSPSHVARNPLIRPRAPCKRQCIVHVISGPYI